jgi:hypothetical protein
MPTSIERDPFACQHKLANEKIAKAKEDKMDNVSHSSRTYTFIANYSQNLDLPHFGGEQAGDTFYYSPLNSIFQFGVVDPTYNDKLHGFVYDEGDGKKGGDNVASLILKLLRLPEINLMEKEEAGGELNFILDNCSGQNKNCMVLQLANLLVESGVFKRVNFLFLVRGHTKNPCNRMFNIFKLGFRKQNVYTMEQLLQVLNAQDQVNALRVQPSDFYDMDAFLDKLYRQFTSGTVHKAHIFSCNVDDEATKMKINVSKWELEDEPEVKTENEKASKEYQLWGTHKRRGFKTIEADLARSTYDPCNQIARAIQQVQASSSTTISRHDLPQAAPRGLRQSEENQE